MNPALEALYQERRAVSRQGKVFDIFPSVIGRHKGRSLYEWVRRMRPRTSLETGLAYGASAAFICQALHDNQQGIHHAMDPYQRSDFDSVGLELVERMALDGRLRFYEAPSHVQLPALLASGLQIEFAFLDGQHLFDYVFIECFYVDLMLPVGGVMALDDPWMPSVRKAARFLIRNRGYTVVGYTNRWLRGAPAPRWMQEIIRVLLTMRYGSGFIKPAFRFESLLYLQKTRSDNRAWNWYQEF